MILVTGASGFLGIKLVRMLSSSGEVVRAVYYENLPTGADATLPGIHWQKADLLDVFDVEEIMKGITRVYHCANIVSFQPAMQDKMLHFNPESTANIVNEALLKGIKKLVYVSSVAALGKPEIKTREITEEEPWGENKYSSAYGLSKYLAETEIWRGIGEGLNAVVVNPGIILGEGDWNKGSAALIKVAWKQFPFYTNGVTAWVDVNDVARILIKLMQSGEEGQRFIVSAGNFSYREIFNHMAAALGRKPPHIYAYSMVTGLIWRLGKLLQLFGKTPVITRETAGNAHALSFYNNEKLLKTMPDFIYTPIEQTIRSMADAFLASI